MSNVVIRVEQLSKQYRLGKIGTGTLSHDINRWWYKLLGKEDPYLKIGESNERTQSGKSEYVWSLRNINLEINQGDTVGIIGRNGAGKSTLLKILSRTTAPTLGSIKIKGRVASLLEVGTGFHPELSGRENIFLNGAILGMTKAEIRKKFEEIVEFAGVQRYVDTPVKRYSSGMYVRLAFGVAAHLEPDILIVDEVLAVGDAEFQKKALGKMNDVSKSEGRTVLFVSHNMGAVKSLCTKGILLHAGELVEQGSVHDVISQYNKSLPASASFHFLNKDIDLSRSPIIIREARLMVNGSYAEDEVIDVYDRVALEIYWSVHEDASGCCLYFQCNKNGDFLFANFEASNDNSLLEKREKGYFRTILEFPSPIFKPGSYSIDLHVSKIGFGSLVTINSALSFNVDLLSRNPRFTFAASNRPGEIVVDPLWHTIKVDGEEQ